MADADLTRPLLDGIAARIGAAGVAVWRPDTEYVAGEIGVVVGLPAAAPDEQIALIAYATDDDPSSGDSTVSVQIRIRGRGFGRTSDLADRVFAELHGLWAVDVGGVHVGYVTRTSSLPLGQDDNGRDELSHNYDFAVAWPTRHRD